MKKIFENIKKWKYKYHALCFLAGILIATIYWLNVGSNETKLAQKNLEKERKITKLLQKKLIPLSVLKKSRDSLILENQKLKTKTITERKIIYKHGNEKINAVNNSTSSERQKFITKWAEENGRNLDVAE